MKDYEMNVQLNEMFNKLNEKGKQTALKRLGQMLDLPQYTGPDTSLTDIGKPEIDYITDIGRDSITCMCFVEADAPIAKIYTADKCHEYPLTNGYQIFIFNEFLKGLDLGLEIEFVTYNQYAQLIHDCQEILSQGAGR